LFEISYQKQKTAENSCSRHQESLVKSRTLKQPSTTRGVEASKANSHPAAALQYTVEDVNPSADDMTVDPIYPVEAYF
jgi:hypothetical protein